MLQALYNVFEIMHMRMKFFFKYFLILNNIYVYTEDILRGIRPRKTGDA